MSYLKPREAEDLFKNRGNKIYNSYASAVESAQKIGERCAVMNIGAGKYIIKKV